MKPVCRPSPLDDSMGYECGKMPESGGNGRVLTWDKL
jgi:hypothetical protein